MHPEALASGVPPVVKDFFARVFIPAGFSQGQGISNKFSSFWIHDKMTNENGMPEEKRRFDRIVYNVMAVLTMDGTDYTVNKIKNLSVGGCLVEIADNLATGSKCTITLYIDGTAEGLKVSVSGEIIRNDSSLVAIQFHRPSQDTLYYLKQIVQHSASILKCNPEIQSYLTIRDRPNSAS